MGYLKNKIITVLLFLAPLVSYGQWSYTFTDPCTLNQQTIQMGSSDEIALNYFGNVQTFTQPDFTDGTFDAWMNLVTQANSANPCQSVTQAITNNTNAIIVQNTITVITNIMNVLGGDMLPQALSSSGVPVAEAIDNANKKKNPSGLITVEPDQFLSVDAASKRFVIATVVKRVDLALIDLLTKTLAETSLYDEVDPALGVYGHRYGISDKSIEITLRSPVLIAKTSVINSASIAASKLN